MLLSRRIAWLTLQAVSALHTTSVAPPHAATALGTSPAPPNSPVLIGCYISGGAHLRPSESHGRAPLLANCRGDSLTFLRARPAVGDGASPLPYTWQPAGPAAGP